ncbi:MAG: HDOD domain-containing protein [Desulfurivibrionaceae bacterium]|nr:HDOD domain-containing protein [Desulfurivibrionaceae bacterium]
MPAAKTLVHKFNDLKTLPHVAIRVTQLVNSEAATMKDFEEIIKLDPILVIRLLKLVNSPYFGLVNKVESISKAVVYIGMKNLRNMVAVEALRNLFTDDDNQEFSRRHLWKHCATVAILARMIAERLFGLAGEDEFLAGIIHDIGLIIEDQLAAQELREVARLYRSGTKVITRYEDEIIETNHCKVGGLLVFNWNMPPEVVEAIKKHHDQEKAYPIPSITSILHIAEYIASRVNCGAVQGRQDPLPPYLTTHMKSRMADYKVLIKDFPAEMAKAEELYREEA